MSVKLIIIVSVTTYNASCLNCGATCNWQQIKVDGHIHKHCSSYDEVVNLRTGQLDKSVKVKQELNGCYYQCAVMLILATISLLFSEDQVEQQASNDKNYTKCNHNVKHDNSPQCKCVCDHFRASIWWNAICNYVDYNNTLG